MGFVRFLILLALAGCSETPADVAGEPDAGALELMPDAGERDADVARDAAILDATISIDAAISPDDAAVSPDDAAVSPDDAAVTPDDAAVTPDDAAVSPDDAAVSPDDAGLPPVEPTGLADTQCSTDGVCFAYPLPTGNDLYGIRATPDGCVFAVGATGTILHHTASGFRVSTALPAMRAELRSVHATSCTSAWAVGAAGTALRWDGTTWARVPSGTTQDLYDVWSDTSGAAWAVGDRATILRWDGARFTPQAAPSEEDYRTIGGTSEDDLLLAGSDQGLFRRTDGVFTAISTSGVYFWGYDVEGVAPNEAFVAGTGSATPTILRVYPTGATTPDFFESWLPAFAGIHYASPTSVLAVGGTGLARRFDGFEWSAIEAPTEMGFTAASGTSDHDTYISSGRGRIFHYDGAGIAYANAPLALEEPTSSVHRLHRAGPNDVWLVTSKSLMRDTGAGFAPDASFAFPDVTIDDISGLGDEVWVVGERWSFDGRYYSSVPFFAHHTPSGWTEVDVPESLYPDRIWASGDDVMLMSGSKWARLDGTTWTRGDVPPHWVGYAESRIDGRSIDSLYRAYYERLYHFDGTAWTEVEGMPENARDLRVLADGTLVVLDAYDGNLHRFDGTTWTTTSLPDVFYTRYDLDLDEAGDVWIAGGGKIVRCEGAACTELVAPFGGNLTTVVVDGDRVLFGADAGVQVFEVAR